MLIRIRRLLPTSLSFTLPLIALGLLAVPAAHATTSALQTDGGVVWCNGNPSSTAPTYSLSYSDGNGGYLTLPTTVQTPDGPNPNDIPDAWEKNSLLWPVKPSTAGPGETAETAALSGDSSDRYVMELNYWNSVGSGLAVQQWDYDNNVMDSGKTVPGAIGYSTGDSCELFYTAQATDPVSGRTANAGQFTITYPAPPSAPSTLVNASGLTEAQWIAAGNTGFPYNGYAPYSGGNVAGGGPTGYVSIYKGCGWDQNSCTAGSATLTGSTSAVNYTLPASTPPYTDWNVFPQKLSMITSIPTTWAIQNDPRGFGSPFDKTTPPEHIWDASYDIWFDTTGITGVGKGPNQYAPARGQNDGLEVMVWMNSNGSYVDGSLGAAGYAAPSGWLRGQVLINNVVYDVWTSRLNNPYYGAYSPSNVPAGGTATATYSNETLVPGGADPDTCTLLAANGGTQYGTCGTEWNVVSFVATKYNGTDYRADSMSMDTKVFTDYILDIPDGGLWQDVGTPAFRTADNTLGCPTHAAQVQYQTALSSGTASDCLSNDWYLTSIDAGFEPWLGGNGLESTSFQAHVETYPSAVQSGVTAADHSAVINWNQPFDVTFPGCPASGGGFTQVSSGTPTMTIVGIQGVEPQYPYNANPAVTTLQPWIPITWLGPNGPSGIDPMSGYPYPDVVSGATESGGQQQLVWSNAENAYVAVINSTYPLSSDASGTDATIYITADCNGTPQVFPTSVFIDPSGQILYSDGKTPVQGATVTLLNSPSDSASGPFEPVPNNNYGLTSDVMNPADNTLNPMPSTKYGNYAWDVSPGYYEVNASLNGCGSVTSPVQHVVSIPITDLDLDLPCAPPNPVNVDLPAAPATPAGLTATATSSSAISLTWDAALPPVNATSMTYTVYEVSPASKVIASGLLGTTYIVTGLNPNTSYSFAVTAVDTGGASAQSETADAATEQGQFGNCHVTYTVTSATPGVNNGLTANINIQNTGTTAIYPWTLAWTFPGNQKISYAWNVNESQSGANVSLSSTASWESIPAGATLTGAVGFNGSYTGADAVPTSFTLNGKTCN